VRSIAKQLSWATLFPSTEIGLVLVDGSGMRIAEVSTECRGGELWDVKDGALRVMERFSYRLIEEPAQPSAGGIDCI
jgi:hypothetical protein